MIANLIAIILTIAFALLGVGGFILGWKDKSQSEFWSGVFFFALAWFCAYLGGI